MYNNGGAKGENKDTLPNIRIRKAIVEWMFKG